MRRKLVQLIAQLVEHCTGIAEVWVQIPLKPEFFRLSFLYCSSNVPNTKKQMKARRPRRSAVIVSRCLEVICQTRVRVFHQGFQTPRNNESTYCYQVFGTPDET